MKRLAQPAPGRGRLRELGVALRRHQRQEVFAEDRPVKRGHGEPAVAGAVAVVSHGERRRRPGLGLLGGQPAGLLGIGDHPRLIHRHLRVREGGVHLWVRLQGGREPGGPVHGRAGGAGLVGQPVRRRRGPHRRTDLDPFGLREQAQLQLRDLLGPDD